MRILFVCLGNICRSPAAQGICEKLYPEHICDSAATSGYHVGCHPDHHSVHVCQSYWVDISEQISRQVTTEDGENFDILFAVDDSVLCTLKETLPTQYHPKIHKLDRHDINDPYGAPMKGFEIMYQHIEESLKTHQLLKK